MFKDPISVAVKLSIERKVPEIVMLIVLPGLMSMAVDPSAEPAVPFEVLDISTVPATVTLLLVLTVTAVPLGNVIFPALETVKSPVVDVSTGVVVAVETVVWAWAVPHRMAVAIRLRLRAVADRILDLRMIGSDLC